MSADDLAAMDLTFQPDAPPGFLLDLARAADPLGKDYGLPITVQWTITEPDGQEAVAIGAPMQQAWSRAA